MSSKSQKDYYLVRHITFQGVDEKHLTYNAPNGKYFTVQELISVIEESERKTRGSSEWFGGIDVHHVFFEGIYTSGNGLWYISWGS